MALGFSSGTSSKNFLPIIKYDARAGRIFRVDRQDGNSIPTDITRNFKAVFDFENIEVGWINFATGSAPDFQMNPLSQGFGERPSPNHSQGFRMSVKLSGECGGDCRELAGTSKVFKDGMEALHNAYLAGLSKNSGKLPVVTLVDTIPVESKGQGQKSTNYQPVFEITGWATRPKDLVANNDDDEPAEPVAAKSPPSTGSTRAAPPKAASPAEEEDFG